MWRKLLGIVIGVAVSMIGIILVEMLGQFAFPPPPGVDLRDPAAIAAAADRIPLATQLSVVTAWFVGTLAGAMAGVAIARWRLVVWIVAGGVIAGAIASYTMIPHPLWMQAAGILLPLVAAWLATRAIKPPASLSA